MVPVESRRLIEFKESLDTEENLQTGSQRLPSTWNLVAANDIEAGALLYKEKPIVSQLFPNLIDKEMYCEHCQKFMPTSSEESITCQNCKLVHFCSSECFNTASEDYHSLLCPSPSSDQSSIFWNELAEQAAASGNPYPLIMAKYYAIILNKELSSSRRKEDPHGPLTHFEFLNSMNHVVVASDKKEADLIKKCFENINEGMIECTYK